MHTTELEPGLNRQVSSTTKHLVHNLDAGVWCNKDMDTILNSRTTFCLLRFHCNENGILQVRDTTTADQAKKMAKHKLHDPGPGSGAWKWCMSYCKCLPIEPLAIADIGYATQSKDMDEKTQGGKRKRESAESTGSGVRPRLLLDGPLPEPLAQAFGAIRRDQLRPLLTGTLLAPLAQDFGAIRSDPLTLPRLPGVSRPPRQGLPPAADHGARDRPPDVPDHRTVGEHDWVSIFDLRGFSLEVSATDILRCNTQVTDSPVLQSRETNCRKLYHCSEIGRFIRRRDTVLARTITTDFGLRTWCNQYCVCSQVAPRSPQPRKAIQLPGWPIKAITSAGQRCGMKGEGFRDTANEDT